MELVDWRLEMPVMEAIQRNADFSICHMEQLEAL